MLIHPDFDPVALRLGPLQVHWYGLMYLLGFIGGWWLGRLRAGRPGSGWKAEEVSDLLFYTAVGVILGGRLGYILFYNLPYYLQHPIEVLYIWTGGMSFHGGLIGVLVAMWLFGRKTGRSFFTVTDFIAPLVPLGLGGEFRRSAGRACRRPPPVDGNGAAHRPHRRTDAETAPTIPVPRRPSDVPPL